MLDVSGGEDGLRHRRMPGLRVPQSKDVDEHSNVHNKRVCKDGPVFLADEVELSRREHPVMNIEGKLLAQVWS